MIADKKRRKWDLKQNIGFDKLSENKMKIHEYCPEKKEKEDEKLLGGARWRRIKQIKKHEKYFI